MEEKIVPLPRAALRRYIIMGWVTSAVLAVPIIGASIYFKQNIALFTLIPLFIIFTLLAYARYTSSGHMIRDNQLVMVYRGLAKYTGIMRRRHVQAVGYSQSYFQKKDELCTANVSVAGHRYKVKHMQKEDALRIYNWYKERKHRRVTVFPLCHDLSISRYSLSNRRYISKIVDIFKDTIDIFEKSPI